MRFIAIDFETANRVRSSICQIGIVSFENGAVSAVWQTLVNPKEPFEPIHTHIHRINEEAVRDAPTFPAVFDRVRELLSEQVVVSHSSFDRVALKQATKKHGLPEIECRWLDSVIVARRTWPEFVGVSLPNVAKNLGITFAHHTAQEDARVAGEIVLRACAEMGRSLEDWIDAALQPIPRESIWSVDAPNPEGPLFGEVVVITGTLSVLKPEKRAAEIAAKAGCRYKKSVTKATTLLVVGKPPEISHGKTGNHREAERLIESGQDINIVSEEEFISLLGL
ncbi:MAG: exonuclease domain-containing protein, partial [Candidatus Sumerlaeota bacterium]|nr:exonuclease domain-containing protein [Candidatus Sumerlaeota bacterium]